MLEKRSRAVNTTMPGNLVPDHGMDLEPMPHITSLLTTSEAARTQRSLAADGETASIPDPEGSTSLVAP